MAVTTRRSKRQAIVKAGDTPAAPENTASKREASTQSQESDNDEQHYVHKRERDTSSPAISTAVESKQTAKKASSVQQQTSSSKKVKAWFKHARTSPYPKFRSPTERECRVAHRLLDKEHGETVRQNFAEDVSSVSYPNVLDGVTVALLSQATSWSNAKRAMASMKEVYGSPFAYDEIVQGGTEKLAAAIRPGGMHNRKSKMLMKVLEQVKEREGAWDLNHLFELGDDEAIMELISYDGIGPKSAYCVLSICLQRNTFAVDTHIYRISGLWGWRPREASREDAQSHLDARVPDELKFALHYLLIVHGRECPACRGGTKSEKSCAMLSKIRQQLSEAEG